MVMVKVLVIGGDCDGQSVYVDIRFDRHAVLPEPILNPAQRVADYSKGYKSCIKEPVQAQIYYLKRVYCDDLAYYLCNTNDDSQICGWWALSMIEDRVRKFEAQKKAGYYD